MEIEKESGVIVENHNLPSSFLEREVLFDIYLPKHIQDPEDISLLLINDGQDLPRMEFENILSDLYASGSIQPMMCVGIHCSKDRRNEYGTVDVLDYNGRGNKATEYSHFIFHELLPFLRKSYMVTSFREKSFCGFSLGGLSAFDLGWENAREFSRIGVFSGSLWWRTVNQTDKLFDEDKHRIIHQKVRNGEYHPWLKFFFETGTMDEIADRNNNGVIDAIDDTLSLIDELVDKGYNRDKDIMYLELSDGRHDVPTWGRAFPAFLKWGWGIEEHGDH